MRMKGGWHALSSAGVGVRQAAHTAGQAAQVVARYANNCVSDLRILQPSCRRWPHSDAPLLSIPHCRRYYRYTGTTLPMQWNCQAEQCLDGNLTGECLPPWLASCCQGCQC